MNARRDKATKEAEVQLRELLNDWDPIGCSPPPDEYDCLHAPILAQLKRRSTERVLAQALAKHISDHMGFSPEPAGLTAFVKRVMAWYRKLET